MRRAPGSRALPLPLLLLAAGPACGQEILRVEVRDLAAVEVRVAVRRAPGSDEVLCLVRDRGGHVRVVAAGPLLGAPTVDGTEVVSLPLPVLRPTDQELAVSLVRGDRELERTPWRPLPRPP